MPPFEKPDFDFTYQVAVEVAALRDYRLSKPGRRIPEKAPDRLLLASWNIANLGVQERRDVDYQLIAELIGWFDIIALQEVNENLEGLRGIQNHLPSRYRALFSDKAGNNERLTFLYDTDKVHLREKVGEVAVPPSDHGYIKLGGINLGFRGFDRNPYLASFEAGLFQFLLVNVHLYFGDDDAQASIDRRCLEAYAVARWADLRRQSNYAYARDIIVLGDFNLPKKDPNDPVYQALTKRGLRLPQHSTQIYSNIANDADFDQIAFFPSETRPEFTGSSGVFDFDGAIFQELWRAHSPEEFRSYMRYYISDHRPLWAEFRI